MSVQKEPTLTSAFRRLSQFDGLDFQGADQDILKATPFWEKRATINSKSLSQKPAYRTMKLLSKLATDRYGIPVNNWQQFVYWSSDFLNDNDNNRASVKRFRSRYGKTLKAQRLLLTTANLIDLYIDTHLTSHL